MYRLQGVKINDKHIETIVRQMLQKVEVEDGGETTLLVGEQVEREEFARANETAEAEGLAPAKRVLFCWASPRRPCRHAHSFLPHHSRKPPAF